MASVSYSFFLLKWVSIEKLNMIIKIQNNRPQSHKKRKKVNPTACFMIIEIPH